MILQKQEMADTKTVKQAILQAVVDAAKATVLTINGEGRRQSMKQIYIVQQRPPDTGLDLP